ncbi:hypothetical protein F2Q69_00028908 [Brassica cretica]|uniref:Uncharacterized protein n=1 Tax=Brassica cretica TaxID=69181 RepID=A0A8S9S4K0_BRACR|nr:hypothetical protein F2Q69_00028908 [Brassica cretica]
MITISTVDETLTSIDLQSYTTIDAYRCTSIDSHSGQIVLKMLKWINLSTIHTCLDCLKEPKLTSNTKPDIIACLGAWYTWDRILQTSLEDPSAMMTTISTADEKSTSIDMLKPATIDAYRCTSIDSHSGQEPKLTSNTKPDIIACLGAWYTRDRILQTSLEDFDSREKSEREKLGTNFYLQFQILVWKSLHPVIDPFKKKQSIDAHPVPSIDTEEKPRRLKIMIDRCTSCTIDRCRDAGGDSTKDAKVDQPVNYTHLP